VIYGFIFMGISLPLQRHACASSQVPVGLVALCDPKNWVVWILIGLDVYSTGEEYMSPF
jgi:hypothetical protein